MKIELVNVSFSYPNGKTVLENFSMEIPADGITAVIGESDCGKTTLLRLIGGLEKPSDGSAGTIKTPERGETAFLFQEDRLFAGLDCQKEITEVLPKGQKSLEAADKYLTAVGLGDDIHTPVEKLSGGMKRRLSLARCLAFAEERDKSILILDEPFSGVDPDRINALMSELKALKKPVIYSTHDTVSPELADRTVKLC